MNLPAVFGVVVNGSHLYCTFIPLLRGGVQPTGAQVPARNGPPATV
jgi:hypothetical protein